MTDFLEQCLFSVQKALRGIDSEIIVADNSLDTGLQQNLQPLFPGVYFLYNTENLGFSKANNRALEHAKGEIILFLNPDTIVPEDFFRETITFLYQYPSAGAAGVRMIDGSGTFLPESKRGFPTVWNSFTKMSGLAALFPGSKFFAGYYKGNLPQRQIQKIEVLSGACMFVKKEVLQQCGGFDERFFMYAEDIDLSYRIQGLGYDLLYLGEITILHFKGESSPKDKNYYKRFYKAMDLFVDKHYGKIAGSFLRLSIKAGAFLARLTSIEKTIEEKSEKATLKGDSISKEEAREILKKNKILEVAEAEAEQAVLCEGEELSFKEIITQIETLAGSGFLIHARGAASIAGSKNKHSRGISFRR